MKHKKTMAIALSMGILASSFSGIYIGYAKNDAVKNKVNSIFDKVRKKAPEPNIEQIAQLAPKQVTEPSINIHLNSDNGEGILYEGVKSTLNPENPEEKDKYSLKKDDIEELVKKGHSIKDIFRADEIGNEIDENPKELLTRKNKEKKSLDKVKEDILKERKEKNLQKLRDKHPEKYNQLKDEKFNDDEILSILAFSEINNVNSLNDLIKDYKKKGNDALKDKEKYQGFISKKEKYNLSDEDVDGVSDEILAALERLSEKTNKPIKELVQNYKRDILNKKGDN